MITEDTVHGNMLLTTFTCEEEEEFEVYRLTVGDRGDFVFCHKACRHRHIYYCKDPAVCGSLAGGRKEGILEHLQQI
ncbi:3471_t:CDS:2 [Ambispora gerdemannii]|uniref:3471_t:CDS:1 n=1 Tax=Ambispora gerdemannii TaxID=144530 RepID=A0A9N8WSX1_9GLOM|nr:3471_t:CDS:2 [Ambispora gerdemannii]